MSPKSNAAVGGGKFVGIGLFLFACLGLALLYPYNAIISATDWFEYVMPNAQNISGALANANFIASLVTTFIILAFASPKEVKETTENPKAPPIRRMSSVYETFTKGVKSSLGLHARIYFGLLIELIPLLVFAIIYPTKGVATVLSAIVGIGDSMAQSGIFPLAGGIHPRCTAAASLGSAIAGLAAGLLRILTKAIFPGDTEESMRLSSSVYFGIAVVILAVCFFAHFFIKKYKKQLTVAFFQVEYAKNTDSFLLQSEAIKNSIQLELGEIEEGEVASAEEGVKEEAKEEAKEEENDIGESIGDTVGFEENPRSTSDTSFPKNKSCHLFSVFVEGTIVYREAFRCAWLPITAQFVNFIITLSLFPGVALSMNSSSLGDWLPVILVTMFNAGDTLGRLGQLSKPVANWIVTPVGEKIVSKSGEHLGNGRPKMKWTIVLPLVFRFAFYPLLIFCVNPLYIDNDAARIVIMLLFSMSNGWVYSVCFMCGPELCKELKHKEATSLLLIVSTLLALGIGSSMGLGIAGSLTA